MKNGTKTNMVWVTFSIILAFIGYDIYAIRNGKPTFSRVVKESSKKYLMIPFLFGVLFGHLFWDIEDHNHADHGL